MSFPTKQYDQPPSYDQVIEVDHPSAPFLHQTFSGSIFGSSTIVTLKLAPRSFPVRPTNILNRTVPCDYSFVITDFFESVQAKGNVSKLNTTVENVNGIGIMQIRPCNSSEPTNQTFEILQDNKSIGLIKYAETEPPGTSLRIYHGHGNSELVVKSLAVGDFAIFRDHSSSTPLCNIQIPDARIAFEMTRNIFDGKIIFHQETGITTEEQILCTAAAISVRVALTHLSIREEADIKLKGAIWGIVFVVVVLAVTFFLMWLVK